jgi:hypothetical protein
MRVSSRADPGRHQARQSADPYGSEPVAVDLGGVAETALWTTYQRSVEARRRFDSVAVLSARRALDRRYRRVARCSGDGPRPPHVLEPSAVRGLIATCARRLPEGELVFDGVPEWLSKSSQRGALKTAVAGCLPCSVPDSGLGRSRPSSVPRAHPQPRRTHSLWTTSSSCDPTRGVRKASRVRRRGSRARRHRGGGHGRGRGSPVA